MKRTIALCYVRKSLVKPGDRLVYLRGTIPGNPVHNAMVVHEVE